MGKNMLGFNTDRQWDYENGFYLTSHATRLAKMLAHYELYKSIIHLPSHCRMRVYKGASLIRFGTFRNLKIIFGKSSDLTHLANFPNRMRRLIRFVDRFEEAGGHGISVDELKEVFAHKAFQNYEFIQGTFSIPFHNTSLRTLS